jgi:hypothetical protein
MLNGTPRFNLGRLLATPGALAALEESNQTALELFARHAAGDWGEELCEEDRQLNDQALIDGGRILSAYRLTNGDKLWVISESDRSSTCVLLPSEY